MENPLFRSYCYYSSILAMKMMAMTLMTMRQRTKHNVFVNDEDVALSGGKISHSNDSIERVRRGHLNDLENIVPFFMVALMYIFTNPDPNVANTLFFYFTFARIVHTVVYTVWIIPQPARFISWLVGFIITAYMSVKSLIYFY